MTDNATLGQNVPNIAEGLYLMDGIKGLLSLPQHSVDMLLTDPPYGSTRNYWDVPLPLPELWEAVKWAVKPNGAALFFAQCPYDKVLGASNLPMLRYEWVWYKERGTGFLNANRAPLKKSENILVFYQKSPVYPTMSIDELCALPVADLAAPDSALFLWATFPQLPEALRLIREWGFTYKSVAFVWLKKNRKADSWFYGLGFWTRANAEVCLLATRGHPKRQAANIHQFIISPIEAHSKKPDEARDKIVALMGDLPRVELFARQTPPGWDVWGNEVQSTLRDFGTTCPKVGMKGG